MESYLKAMLCSPVDVVPESDEWALEGKLDGWRAVAHVTSNGVGLYGGRNGSAYTGKLPYIADALEKLLPPDSAIDGELIGEGWGDVQGVMTRGNGPHVPSKAIPALTYVVFDITRQDGEDLRALPWQERRETLEVLFSDAELKAHKIDCIKVTPYGDASDALHQQMLALGLEGSVCKRKDSRYEGRRTQTWVKIKPQETADATVVGFKDGKGSFAGLIGAIEFKLPNGQRSRCSGLTMKLRKALSANRDAFIGRTIEVKHHGETAEGKLRHPQFLRFRDDKDRLSAREQQVQEALLEAADEPTTRERQVAVATRGPAKRRMRNYGAMNDDKLLRCIRELENHGEAYRRAEDSGSGNPEADLAAARMVAQDRGL